MKGRVKGRVKGRMSAWMPLLLPALAASWLCGWAGAAWAQDALVRTRVVSTEPLWVGQEVVLQVELLAPGYFASAASFDLPDPDGVLLMPPASHPVVGNETIGNTLYTSQLHRLRAWPMRAGQQTIPPVTIRFQFKRHPLDAAGEPASVTTEALALAVQVPPGAGNLGSVISARNLTVEETWLPEPAAEPVKAGVAYTRTVTFSAPGVPGMVFPPFPAGDIEGLGIYTKRQLLDRDERGELTGVRQDRITYVLKRPGQYTVPATRYTWFDLDAQQLRIETLPARTFNVIVNPDMASAAAAGAAQGAGTPGELRWWYVAAGGALVLALAILARRSPRWRPVWRRWLAPLRPVPLEPLNPGDK